jgi:uncharacterized metal-binding protein YceD (DUF177 family)
MDSAPPFSRPVKVRALKVSAGHEFDLSPSAAEAGALAAFLGLRGLENLRFAGRIRPAADGALALTGRLAASVTQDCVVTLAPVRTEIAVAVRRDYVSARNFEQVIDLDPEADDELEPLGAEIDLGALAAEELALALPAYPRAPGVPEGGEWHDRGEASEHPFAALARIRDRLPD